MGPNDSFKTWILGKDAMIMRLMMTAFKVLYDQLSQGLIDLLLNNKN